MYDFMCINLYYLFAKHTIYVHSTEKFQLCRESVKDAWKYLYETWWLSCMYVHMHVCMRQRKLSAPQTKSRVAQREVHREQNNQNQTLKQTKLSSCSRMLQTKLNTSKTERSWVEVMHWTANMHAKWQLKDFAAKWPTQSATDTRTNQTKPSNTARPNVRR